MPFFYIVGFFLSFLRHRLHLQKVEDYKKYCIFSLLSKFMLISYHSSPSETNLGLLMKMAEGPWIGPLRGNATFR